MSAFEIRGFIEGFYGRVWNDSKREYVLRLMGKKGMNSYFYAPKDDKYLRAEWRKEYDKASLRKFSKLLSVTAEAGMNLWYCISPGLDICYSSEKDFSDLIGKIMSLYKTGVRHFGLLLDDIPANLIYKEDKKAFGTVCKAHISLVNRLYKAIPEGVKLAVCPLQYHGTGEEPFITEFCRGIPDNINVFWTGKKICSPELTAEEAKRFYNSTGHKPLYWDNFPVNDAEMYGEIHLGPLMNRDPELSEYSHGIVSNVMEYPLSSCIPLLTVCDYLNAPESYDPEKSYVKALKQMLGKEWKNWLPFLDNTRYSCLCDCFSEDLSNKLSDIKTFLSAGNNEKALTILGKLINDYRNCAAAMKNSKPLLGEIKNWYARFNEITKILVLSEKFIKKRTESNRLKLKQAMIAYNLNAYKLAGFGLREYVEYLIGEFTV